MTTTDLHYPISHTELRALLRIIERAYDQSDSEALHDCLDIVKVLSSEYHEALQVYICGLEERLLGERDYRMYNDVDVSDAKLTLERIAYGDFDEAMDALAYDLRGIDRYRGDEDMQSLLFRPEFFTEEDRQKWKELQDVALDCLHQPNDPEREHKTEAAVLAIRSYQQRSFGPLIPTLTATYRRENEGVSVRLAWFDECLHVMTHAPFYEELDEYFINTSPIDGIADFIPKCFPEQIGGYRLGGIESVNLFQYELYPSDIFKRV